MDLYLSADPLSRVAVETLCTTNKVVLAGEVRGPKEISHADLEQAARDCVKKIGYEDSFTMFRQTVKNYKMKTSFYKNSMVAPIN